MTPERWKQIEELYAAALDSGQEERASLIARASPEVRAAVLEMLTQKSAGNILDRPAWEAVQESPDPDNSPHTPPLASGSQLGPYRIEGILGEGGMGEVYRAHDSRLRREVAVKILPRAWSSDPERLRRFEQEARAAGALNHPNILTIFDVGTHDGISYLVSELLEGETLRERLNSGDVPRRKALEYAHLIAVGLTAAHERGITHRDLKPENLFLTRDGRLKILDFGLAKFTGPATTIWPRPEGNNADTKPVGSQPGLILGTVGYMSPEQVRSGAVDQRSDLFNLGAILYEMLTGRRAFRGSTTIETLNAILKEEPPLSDDDPSLGPGLTRLLRHCLEKDPRERFQSAKDLAFDLEALATLHPSGGQTVPNELRQLTAQAVAHRPETRWRVKAAVAVVALSIAYFGGHEIAKLQVISPTFHQVTYRNGFVTGGRFTPDGQEIVYSAAWDGRPVQTFRTRADAPESLLIDVPGAPATGVLAISARSELALTPDCHLNWAECSGPIARMPLEGGAPKDVLAQGDYADWDPAGNGLAVVRPAGGQYGLEYPIGKVLYQTRGWITHPRFSPHGDRIAFLDHPTLHDNDGSVVVVDLNGKKTTQTGILKGLKGLAWSPSGEEVWFSGGTNRSPTLWAVNRSGQQRVVLEMLGWAEILDIARDGRVLLLRQNPRSIIMYRPPDGSKDRRLSWFDWSTAADLSSDGRTLLFYEWGESVGGVPTVYVRPTEGGDAKKVGEGKALALAPDGKSVLALRAPLKTGSPQELIVLPIGVGEPKVLPHSGIQEYYTAAWFPGGKKILITGEDSDGSPRSFVQDIEGGDAHPITKPGYRAALISKTGEWLAAYGPDNLYYLIPLAGGEPRQISQAEPGDELIQWSADGRFLYVRGSDESVVELFQIDLSSGRRTSWKTLEVPNDVGLIGIQSGPGAVPMTADGKSVVYTFWQGQGELHIAEGLK